MENFAEKKPRKTHTTPFKFDLRTRRRLEELCVENGNSTMVDVVSAMILESEYNPEIEKMIKDYAQEHKCTRGRAIEALLIQTLKLRTLLVTIQGQQQVPQTTPQNQAPQALASV